MKDIDLTKPHRAHLEILDDLSLPSTIGWVDMQGKRRNFDNLLAGWLAKLDTEELNRRFYRELFAWFERAVTEAKFPLDQSKPVRPEENVIRLITRLMFVWFMKEKGLVAMELFSEARVREILRDYDAATGNSYYPAVLQNLFFATLNTEIGNRQFSTTHDRTDGEFSRYHYADLISEPEALQALFDKTPFINGGLFECLDTSSHSQAGSCLIDCFSDNLSHRAKLSLPNRLFFDHKGLIRIFESYKFTVEESTPIEQEVALDPELLGSVFENLLAAYNPETRETVRKQTGSYYTPRPVVDYMVKESLALALAEKVTSSALDAKRWKERILRLVDEVDAFTDVEELFNKEARCSLVRVIAELAVLDPAVGSGAFPMAVLHTLTLALRRLDPENQYWEGVQRERAGGRAQLAYQTSDDQVRQAALEDVDETFRRYRDSDYGRKLYLIQSTLFGLDIQPIACQIAKLRFFISLAIEQKTKGDINNNYGIRPLPNLETRFIAADSLLGIAGQATLRSTEQDMIERELRENRERHFNATTHMEKVACRKIDKELRQQLAEQLRESGLGDAEAGRIAAWSPYDQNTVANWFDAEYMFGTRQFDVVLGNPPYIQLQRNRGELARRYRHARYETFASTGDIYQLFYERGIQLLRDGTGVLAFITSNSWLKAEYGKIQRRYLSEVHSPLALVEMGKDIFGNAIVDTAILIVRCGTNRPEPCIAVDVEHTVDGAFPPSNEHWGTLRMQGTRPWLVLSRNERSIMDKMESRGTPLKDWDISIYRGILTGCNDAFIVDNPTKEALVSEDPNSAKVLRPILRGRDIRRYRAHWAGQWLIDLHNGYRDVPPVNADDFPAIKRHLNGFRPRIDRRQDQGVTPYNLRSCAYHGEFKKDKLFWMHMSASGRFSYSDTEVYCNQKAFMVVGRHLKYLCGVLNSAPVTMAMKQIAVTTGMGLTQWDKFSVQDISIPMVPREKELELEKLVNEILEVKAVDIEGPIQDIEENIDRFVFDLYDLTWREIRSIRDTLMPQ